MKKYYLLLLATFLFSSLNAQVINLESFGPLFSNPVEISQAGDTRLFVAEQSGTIQILNNNGSVNPIPFLDIRGIVNDIDFEQGLLGLAFAPDYNTTGRFYINYTDSTDATIIARYTVSSNPNVANPNGTIILTIPQPFTNHNAGKLAFGSDGYLYIATGDGGDGGDPGNRAQNLNELLGKILRIDVSGNTYSIPSSNPFVGTTGLDEIWAYGLRNPWKFSFDKLNNDIWIADVGQNVYEEINRSPSTSSGGENYGWNCREGQHNYVPTTCGNTNSGYIEPVSEYNHNGGKCSITGGYRYRGNLYPGFNGWYFFADFCSQEIGYLTQNGATWNSTLITPNITRNWSTFGEDINGELYIAGGNRVYKITDSNLSVNEFNISVTKIYPNPANENIHIRLPISEVQQKQKITIYNLQGKALKIENSINTSLVHISISSLASGLYIVEISDQNGNKTISKLIKE